MKRSIRLASTLALLSAILVGCNDEKSSGGAPGQGAERPPTPVSVLIMKKGDHELTSVLPGRATAYQVADIRPRVSGVIKKTAFREGSTVKAGDLLYKIEDDTYQASVAEAEATLARAEASVPTAKQNLARYERLVNSGATQIEYDNAKVTLLQAQADVAEAKAALQSAQINLDLTDVRAPFDGVTSASAFSVGNVVTANQTDALMTLRQLDPIYIELTESSTNLLKLKKAIADGQLNQSGSTSISLMLEDGINYPQKGELDMSEMAVSETTGTYSIRALFKNPNELILPGMYVRAQVSLGHEQGYLIPQLAATRNARGELQAKFVTADNKVETRLFENGKTSGNSWIVTDGVKDGDKLIVDGFQWIADGAAVKPVEATVDENGLVVEDKKSEAPEAKSEAKP
ncbi:efflux RND transporter periplasmic adaptor subunit [Rhizobium halophytocola]|uniref:Membrane fusion protein (Multidrug efflux system) n=1 Tax=Rhizobium halophytocola TaxID=735519 RepID=A0ABS4E265_9HYPH|nr:efflux RND transporter periplasmic adaptor subunit [Rhizobium halophytocola]MBP1852044.1 membrane fusion protein (multidrug efflux system) [Rhizobium halophytocola]